MDRERVIKETESREIRKKTVLDNADSVRLFNNPGFTIDRLMGDIRYRVNAALTEAGLAESAYGKEVLRGLPSGSNSNIQGGQRSGAGT